MRYQLLGGLAADDDGVQVDLGAPKQRAVLAILLLERNRVVPTDRIVELLWGDAPDKAIASLQSYVSRLRSALEPGRQPRSAATVLVSQPPGYRLDVDREQVDLYRFEDEVTKGLALLSKGSDVAAVDALESAIDTFGGSLLPELANEPFVRIAALRMANLRLTAVEAAAEAHLAMGDHRRAATVAGREADEHPARERLHGLLALALYRDGRQADAVRAIGNCRRALVESTGLDPGPDLRGLESDILARAPTLDWQRPDSTLAAPGRSDVAADPPQLDMIGREREVRVIDSRIADLAAGRGGIVLLIGEPGIGKTHIAEFAVEAATNRDLSTAWVRCPESGAVPPFWPITHLGHQLRLAGLVGVDRDRTDWEPGVDGSARFGLYRTVIDALDELDRPTLLVIDDLQWADPDTVRLLEHIADEFTSKRVLLVATIRPTDENSEPRLIACLSILSQVADAVTLTLSGLQVDDVAEWCAARTGGGVPRAVAELVHDRTGGNPLFVKELTALLSSEDRLADVDAVRAARKIPPGVQFVVRRRVSRLKPPTQKLLSVAAVIGPVFRLESLAAAMDTDPGEVLALLGPALDAGLVTDTDDRFAFSHVLVADALASEVNAARRSGIHAAVARALASDAGAGFGLLAAEIAHHAHHGILAGTGDLAIQASTSAARLATARLADDDAAHHWRAVADALRRSRPSDIGARVDALVESATALLRVDRVGPAKQVLLDAIEVAEAAGLVDEMARAATLYNTPDVWVAGGYGSVDAAVVGAIRRTLTAIRSDDHPTRALLLGALARELVFAPADEHAAVCRDAEAEARRTEDPAVIAAVLANQILPLRPRSLERRRGLVGEFRSIAATTPLDAELIYSMEFHRAECLLEVGALAQAHEIETAAFRDLDANLGAKLQSQHDWLAAAIATANAHYEDAERLIQDAYDGHRRGRLHDGETLWLAGKLAVAQDIGGLEELMQFATATAATSAYQRGAAEALAFALLELGSVNQARSIVGPFGPDSAFPDDYSTLCCAAAALHVRVELDDREGAEAAAGQLVEFPDRWAAAGSSPLSTGSVALALGRFEAMRGDVDAARSQFSGRCCVVRLRGASALGRWRLIRSLMSVRRRLRPLASVDVGFRFRVRIGGVVGFG